MIKALGNFTVAYIGLGSNLNLPIKQILSARQDIVNLDGVEEIAFSSLYSSAPMGPQDQPDYINAAMAIKTILPPLDLLHALQKIELAHGRIRERRWGARTLDLDLLIYGDQQMNTPELTVPHPGVTERAFVLCPLYDCNPELVIPGKGLISEWVKQCFTANLNRINNVESDL